VGRSLAKLLDVDVPIPHHTSLVKRAAKLGVEITLATVSGTVDVVVDSTGLKVYGEGEWKVRQHGADKRRDWRKVHLAVDPDSHAILAQLVTDSRSHDRAAALPLLEEIDAELQTFFGDGAYDQQKVYDALERRDACAVIPPRRRAKESTRANSSRDRNEAIRQIDRHGRQAWKEQSGYHRRASGKRPSVISRAHSSNDSWAENPPTKKTESRSAANCSTGSSYSTRHAALDVDLGSRAIWFNKLLFASPFELIGAFVTPRLLQSG
jgi:IS5 family transposase